MNSCVGRDPLNLERAFIAYRFLRVWLSAKHSEGTIEKWVMLTVDTFQDRKSNNNLVFQHRKHGHEYATFQSGVTPSHCFPLYCLLPFYLNLYKYF